MQTLPHHLMDFIKNSQWTFAKTYADTWPHEYIVQQNVDHQLFLELAHHIDTHGYKAPFYDTEQIYFDYDGHTYWRMENIINRCLAKDTYERRKEEGRLPEDKDFTK